MGGREIVKEVTEVKEGIKGREGRQKVRRGSETVKQGGREKTETEIVKRVREGKKERMKEIKE